MSSFPGDRERKERVERLLPSTLYFLGGPFAFALQRIRFVAFKDFSFFFFNVHLGSQVAQLVNNLLANARDVTLIPGSGRSP